MPRKFPVISSDEFIHLVIKHFGCWEDRENKHPTMKRKRGNGEVGTSVPKRKELGRGILGRMLRDLDISAEEFLRAYHGK